VRAGYWQFGPGQDLPGLLRQLGARTAVFDVEPLVAIWDTPTATLDQGISRVLAELAGLPDLEVVCFATNSARAPGEPPGRDGLRVIYLASARKPLDIEPYRDLPRPGVVVGDQVATDGILARRLGFMFLHYRHPLAGAPIGPRLMNRCGQLVRPLVFRRRTPA
jgi:hypothetical protein